MFQLESEVDSNLVAFSDSLENASELKTHPKSFSSSLQSSFVFGAAYQLYKPLELSGYYVHFMYRGEYRPMFLLNVNYSLKNWLVTMFTVGMLPILVSLSFIETKRLPILLCYR